jgi:hypothetical protein
MSSKTVPAFSAQDNPAGQITLSVPGAATARASALVGYRVDKLLQFTSASIVHMDDPVLYRSAN